MKNTLKLIALTLVVSMLLIGVAVPASANGEAPELSIDYCNLSFRDSVCIKYAVASTSTEETTVLLWDEPSDEYLYGTHIAELSTVGNQTISGETYKVFDYTELAAKQMTDVIYARAYTVVDGEAYYSDVVKYSILQYAYSKLGKIGTASDDENLKAMLSSMLEYGANAQKYFEYDVDRLATDDFYQIKVVGGLIEDQCNHGLFLEGDKVNVIAPKTDGDGIAFVGWINENGDVVAETAEATITVETSNDVYTAIYGEIPADPDKPVPSEGLEYESNGDGTCYLISKGDCTDTDIVIPDTSPDGDTVFAIDRNAFADEAITSITIPTTIEEIGRNAFNGCDSLTDVYYLGTEQEWETLCENVATGNTALLNADVHFAEEEVAYDEPTFVVESVIANAGDTVDVIVSLAKNPGIMDMALIFTYDDTALSLTGTSNGDALSDATFMGPKNMASGCRATWYYMDEPAEYADGSVITLTFDVLETAESGDYEVSVEYGEKDVNDIDGNPLSFTIESGKVTVE